MATVVVANGGGNWNTAATWRNTCTGAGALLTTLTAAETESGTSYVYSVAFTVTNAENIEGVALHLRRSGTTGTLTVGLSDDNGVSAAKEVTVNLSDLPDAYSWVFFKFASVLAADGGADYRVGVKMSAGSSGISIWRGSATPDDWSHILREDTAPADVTTAGTVFYIFDDLKAAASKDTNTVTMDAIAAAITDFGAVTVGFGTLNFGVTAATAYYLKVSGDLTVWGGGTFTMGTTGTKMPSDSTAVLEFDPSSDGEFGLICKDGSTVTLQGNPLTKVWTLLNADAAVNATTLTTADSTAWLDNDVVCVGTTSRTYSECEKGTVNVAPIGTALTVDGFAGAGGGIAYAHSGTAGGPNGESTRAEIINLTRNVVVRSSSATVMAYVYCATTSTCDWDYAEFYYLGENTAGKRGIEVATTTGSFNMQYCSLHDCEDWGFYSVTASGSPTFSNNVTWNLNSAAVASTRGVHVVATSGTPVFDGNVFMAHVSAAGGYGINLLDEGATFTNNRIVGINCGDTSGTAINIAETNGIYGTFSGNNIHGSRGTGLTCSYLGGGTISTLTSWRNAYYGVYISSPPSIAPFVFNTGTVFGNTYYNISCGSTSLFSIRSYTVSSEASYTTGSGLYISGNCSCVWVYDSSFGTGSVHTTDDIDIGATGVRVCIFNTTLASTAEAINAHYGAAVYGHKIDTSGFRDTYKYGTVQAESSLRHTASGYSWKLTPSNATYKLIMPGPLTTDTFKAAVASGAAVTVTAWVVKDSTYNGNAPRLVLVGNIVAGIDDATSAFTQTAKTITNASNAAPIVITSNGHGYADGDRVLVDSVGGNTAANGSWTVANKTDNTFELAGSTGNGDYTAGGKSTRWEQLSLTDTPSEAGVIEWYIDCDGTAGNMYVDNIAVAQ